MFQSHDWPIPFISTSLHTLFPRATEGLYLRLKVHNGTHFHVIDVEFPITYDKWHHLGIVYSLDHGIEVYVDGCKQVYSIDGIKSQNPEIRNFHLGCNNGGNCVKLHYDDLKFWAVRKTQQFMWWLWSM